MPEVESSIEQNIITHAELLEEIFYGNPKGNGPNVIQDYYSDLLSKLADNVQSITGTTDRSEEVENLQSLYNTDQRLIKYKPLMGNDPVENLLQAFIERMAQNSWGNLPEFMSKSQEVPNIENELRRAGFNAIRHELEFVQPGIGSIGDVGNGAGVEFKFDNIVSQALNVINTTNPHLNKKDIKIMIGNDGPNRFRQSPYVAISYNDDKNARLILVNPQVGEATFVFDLKKIIDNSSLVKMLNIQKDENGEFNFNQVVEAVASLKKDEMNQCIEEFSDIDSETSIGARIVRGKNWVSSLQISLSGDIPFNEFVSRDYRLNKKNLENGEPDSFRIEPNRIAFGELSGFEYDGDGNLVNKNEWIYNIRNDRGELTRYERLTDYLDRYLAKNPNLRFLFWSDDRSRNEFIKTMQLHLDEESKKSLKWKNKNEMDFYQTSALENLINAKISEDVFGIRSMLGIDQQAKTLVEMVEDRITITSEHNGEQINHELVQYSSLGSIGEEYFGENFEFSTHYDSRNSFLFDIVDKYSEKESVNIHKPRLSSKKQWLFKVSDVQTAIDRYQEEQNGVGITDLFRDNGIEGLDYKVIIKALEANGISVKKYHHNYFISKDDKESLEEMIKNDMFHVEKNFVIQKSNLPNRQYNYYLDKSDGSKWITEENYPVRFGLPRRSKNDGINAVIRVVLQNNLMQINTIEEIANIFSFLNIDTSQISQENFNILKNKIHIIRIGKKPKDDRDYDEVLGILNRLVLQIKGSINQKKNSTKQDTYYDMNQVDNLYELLPTQEGENPGLFRNGKNLYLSSLVIDSMMKEAGFSDKTGWFIRDPQNNDTQTHSVGMTLPAFVEESTRDFTLRNIYNIEALLEPNSGIRDGLKKKLIEYLENIYPNSLSNDLNEERLRILLTYKSS